ncbi:hypothetical protein B0H15DRAFT_952769 [Mycena belliarum]|uniref:Uncharacterized protein n=1 Tax=Mycena belliarum TaxID=1033014 RepID=A0AAD6TYJ3_9AGAR|nr:hypothetical protein B0H15DRAFT_952769 [Mycena belliae]
MPTSSVETPDHLWLVSMYPENLRFFHALGLKDTETVYDPYQVVPRTGAGQKDWAYVGRNPGEHDMTRGLLLLYKHAPVLPNTPSGTIHPVGIRVQGFIERVNMKPMGTWTPGKSAASALQFWILNGGDHGDVFAGYKAAAQDTLAYIYKCLDVAPPTDNDHDSESMFIARRVFTKVTGSNKFLPDALERGDDPMGLCKSIEREWRVLSKCSIGMYLPDDYEQSDSAIVPCDGMALSEGDFVDVCVGFDIVNRRGRKGETNIQVHLKLEHVLLLAAAQDISKDEDPLEPISVQNPGLMFF